MQGTPKLNLVVNDALSDCYTGINSFSCAELLLKFALR